MRVARGSTGGTIVSYSEDDIRDFAMVHGFSGLEGKGWLHFDDAGRVLARGGSAVAGEGPAWDAFAHECFSHARTRGRKSGVFERRVNPFGRREGYESTSFGPPSWSGPTPSFRIQTGFLVGSLYDPEVVGDRAARIPTDMDPQAFALRYALKLRDTISWWLQGEISVYWGDGVGEEPAWLETRVVDLWSRGGEREEYWEAAIDVNRKLVALDEVLDEIETERAAAPPKKRGWFGG